MGTAQADLVWEEGRGEDGRYSRSEQIGAELGGRGRRGHRGDCLGARRAHVGMPQRQSRAFSFDAEH